MDQRQTRFAHRLRDWMSSQRPPYSSDQLATWLHVPLLTVGNWLNGRSVPDPSTLAKIAHSTRIPLRELYELADIPVPEPVADEAERWGKTIAQVVASMRAKGYGEDAIQQIIAHTRDREFGTNRERYVRPK
jgi:transcriptional regulator with XRE-family HTH domain